MTITLTVIHGADRGKIYSDLSPPITIGREEGNEIHLNDERVSRFHIKIQMDGGRFVLTDLDSTNGTKVNGAECHLRILRYGDLIAIGRSLLLFGNECEIAATFHSVEPDSDHKYESGIRSVESCSPSPYLHDLLGRAKEKPKAPDRLSPIQLAQVSEIIEFMRSSLHRLIASAHADEVNEEVKLKYPQWQNMLNTQAHLGVIANQISVISSSEEGTYISVDQPRNSQRRSPKDAPFVDEEGAVAETVSVRIKQICDALTIRRNVMCRGGRQIDEIQRLLRERDLDCIRMLGEGFDRVFVFSGEFGNNDAGDFDLALFQQHIFEEFVSQLGLEDDRFRLAELPQFLKSKNSSDLYCFLSAECIPRSGMECLRGLGFFSHHSSSIYFGENEQLTEWTGVELEV